jgi:hypothetical protein
MATPEMIRLEQRLDAMEAQLKSKAGDDAVADLRIQLEDNVDAIKDQQEAMDALMDMLDKTITVEDTHDLMNELEQKKCNRALIITARAPRTSWTSCTTNWNKQLNTLSRS